VCVVAMVYFCLLGFVLVVVSVVLKELPTPYLSDLSSVVNSSKLLFLNFVRVILINLDVSCETNL
jgi:hypothetical protein